MLTDTESFPRWWPAMFLSAETTERGGDGGVGAVTRVGVRMWRPRVFHGVMRVTERRSPSRYGLGLYGDIEGEIAWELSPGADENTTVVQGEHKLVFDGALGALSTGIFSRELRWALSRGEESLALELARRRARDSSERDGVKAPPLPGVTSSLPVTLGVVGALGAVAAGIAMILKRRER